MFADKPYPSVNPLEMWVYIYLQFSPTKVNPIKLLAAVS
jgi:hypothetical protein